MFVLRSPHPSSPHPLSPPPSEHFLLKGAEMCFAKWTKHSRQTDTALRRPTIPPMPTRPHHHHHHHLPLTVAYSRHSKCKCIHLKRARGYVTVGGEGGGVYHPGSSLTKQTACFRKGKTATHVH